MFNNEYAFLVLNMWYRIEKAWQTLEVGEASIYLCFIILWVQ